MDQAAIGSLAPWFGGKRTLAPEVVAELGPHDAYWEPFCGSMAVLLGKPASPHEYVNDLHGDLINLARVIQDPHLGPRLYRMLRRTWLMEEMLDHCKGLLGSPSLGPLVRAFCYFVESWLGRNGLAGTHSSNAAFCIRYTGTGGPAARRWVSAVDSIPAWRRRLRNVAISNRDAFELLERIEDAPGVAIYVDPPYLVKGARYVHDFTAADHDRLAAALARYERARVVVSYYEHPRLAELYPRPRWTHRRIEVSKAMAHQGRRGANDTRAVEVLLLNGPSRVETRTLF